ncbi:uncharacterized protein LOC128234115 isoform X2 [Mya arenaria]|uniref:uncharacterized protein LOC128234115 isoform X2 n=1 Tax=Mya arenaria TaxID=6604 RepID=UPI0022DEE338|nr:uncharacterized protein LOC128234115 isoform X2 [Mya arenaria]
MMFIFFIFFLLVVSASLPTTGAEDLIIITRCEDTIQPRHTQFYHGENGTAMSQVEIVLSTSLLESNVTCEWKVDRSQDVAFILALNVHRCLTMIFPFKVYPWKQFCVGEASTANLYEDTSLSLRVDATYDVDIYIYIKMPTLARKGYVIHEDPKTWTEAQTGCRKGSKIADENAIYKVLRGHYSRAHETEQLVKESGAIWTDKILSPWVWLIGCVAEETFSRDTETYETSKHNQMTECGMACRGYSYFLLQGRRCLCSRVHAGGVEPMFRCNLVCPGSWEERCGGEGVFTAYKFRTQKTYISNKPEFDVVKPWREAVQFCSNQPGSTGLAMTPHYQNEALFESDLLWTSLNRKPFSPLDPIVEDFKPTHSYVVPLGGSDPIDGIQLRLSGEIYPFICEFDFPNCGIIIGEALEGIITSPHFPDHYPPNIYCVWTVQVPTGMTMKLDFVFLDMEDVFDYVTIQEPTGVDHGPYYGHFKHLTVATEVNKVTVTFRSDDSFQKPGFKLHWTAVDIVDAKHAAEGPVTTGSRLSGGAIAGLVIGCMFLVMLMFLCAIAVRSPIIQNVVYTCHLRCCIAKHRHGERSGSPVISQASNVLYGVSSFSLDSDVNASHMAYENTRRMQQRAAGVFHEPSSHAYCEIDNLPGALQLVNIERTVIKNPQNSSKADLNHCDDDKCVCTNSVEHHLPLCNGATACPRSNINYAEDDGGYLNDDVTGIPKHEYVEVKVSTVLGQYDIIFPESLTENAYVDMKADKRSGNALNGTLLDTAHNDMNGKHSSSYTMHTKVNKPQSPYMADSRVENVTREVLPPDITMSQIAGPGVCEGSGGGTYGDCNTVT